MRPQLTHRMLLRTLLSTSFKRGRTLTATSSLALTGQAWRFITRRLFFFLFVFTPVANTNLLF